MKPEWNVLTSIFSGQSWQKGQRLKETRTSTSANTKTSNKKIAERKREEAGTRGKEAALCSFCEYYYTRN